MKFGKVNFRNNILLIQFLGDALFAFIGLSLGYVLRFYMPLERFGITTSGATYAEYLSLILLGLIILLSAFTRLGLYKWKMILRQSRLKVLIIKGTTVWLLVYLGLSLAFKVEPAISRLFVIFSWFTVILLVVIWREVFVLVLNRFNLAERLVQRVAIIGWNDDARNLAHAIYGNPRHPYTVEGVIVLEDNQKYIEKFDHIYPKLGELSDLERIIGYGRIDILVIAELNLSREQLSRIAAICEQRYVDLKMVPSMFQIFISGLRLETISGLPILGIEELQVNQLFNQILKRATDIVGSIVGLMISAVPMLILAIMIKRQDPGPVIYRQMRTGLHGKPFTIYKLRSMRQNAEQAGAQWAVENDPRRLPIGAFMRSWNLDELPQFWNVLKGDMSLVGPRPERPELIDKFEQEIDHYNPRHEVKPGITGWAQVNGLRGNTSLEERIRFDIYYIENWNWFWDWQIMLLTFFKRDNAY